MPEQVATETPPTVGEETVKSDKELIAEEEQQQAAETEKETTEQTTDEVEKAEKPKKEKKPKVPFVFTKDWEEGKVYLYQSSRTPLIPSLFPRELLLETWLKLHGVPYENVRLTSGRKERLPFVELNGEKIAGGDVLPRLAQKFEKNVSSHLTQEQLNVEHAMVKMVENHLHWYVMDWRTKTEDNTVKAYKLNLPTYFQSSLPPAVLSIHLKLSLCKKVQKQKRGQGFTDLEQQAKQDMKVVSEMLGDKDFMFGSDVSMLDLVVFSVLALLLMVDPEYECKMRDWVGENLNNLVQLVTRLKEKVWGDHWDAATGDSLDLNPHIPKPEPETEAQPEEEDKEEEKKDEEKKDEEKVEPEVEEQVEKDGPKLEKRKSFMVSLKNMKTRVFPRTKKTEETEDGTEEEDQKEDKKEEEEEEKKDEEKIETEQKEDKTDGEKLEVQEEGEKEESSEKKNSFIVSLKNIKSRMVPKSKKGAEAPESDEKLEEAEEEKKEEAPVEQEPQEEGEKEKEKEKKTSIMDSLKNIKSRMVTKSKKTTDATEPEEPQEVEAEKKEDSTPEKEVQEDGEKDGSEKKNSIIDSLKNIKSKIVPKSKKVDAPELGETTSAEEEEVKEKAVEDETTKETTTEATTEATTETTTETTKETVEEKAE